MRVLLIVFVHFVYCWSTQGLQDYEITYPERLHSTRHKRDLSTAIDGGHENSANFAIKAFKNKWILDTNLNERVAPQNVFLRQFMADNSETITKEAPDQCHFQGSIRDIPESIVALSTCNGLSGVIDNGVETYHIEPRENYKETGAHKIYPANKRKEFGMPIEPGFHDSVVHNESDYSSIGKYISRVRRNVANVGNQYMSYLTTNETRYNEVLFVVDNGIYQRFENDSKIVLDRVITLCNVLDAIYQRINIRIVLSAVEIWSNGDRIPRYMGDLGKFAAYTKEIRGKMRFDNAQFLSHIAWPGAAGIAYVGTMCGSLSVGINSWKYAWGSHIGPYIVVAHEMGHNFNFPHDNDKCNCLSPKGCVMQYYPNPRVLGFSECSLNALKKINDRCLYNVPTKAVNAKCGNGIREGDEECDCGTPEMCKAEDPCCLPHDCRLKPEALCSDLHHSCCNACQYKKQGTLCRAVKTSCDVPEYCQGDSRDCPADTSLRDGTPCNRTNKLLMGNTNWYSVVTNELSPHIEARYIRINPQYWHEWICMRAELYGCSAEEVNADIPTPLKPFNDFCIVPQDQKCIPEENTKVIFKYGVECKEDYMNFRLDANGTLWHHCSGRRVCPQNGNTHNGARLVISSSCKQEYSKFARTPEKSLMHVKSGKCVHPIGAWPADGRHLGLWAGCGIQRLEIWFIKPDCVSPLGLQSGNITNEQMTASSSRKPLERPYHGRLHLKSFWCAAKSKKSEYLQINLKKTMRISKVAVQGRGNWYNWVKAYFLYYSQDGKRWTGYSESGDSIHSNSYCFTGKCAETRDTQCRDLWGPKSDDAPQACYEKLNIEANGFGTCDAKSNSSCAAALKPSVVNETTDNGIILVIPSGFGTEDTLKKHVLCGQIQCSAETAKPVVDYGKSYKKLTLTDSLATQCSAAVLKQSDMVGQGMVTDGTKCGQQKMCMNSKCQSFEELNIAKCSMVNGVECNGRGVCTNVGICHCDSGYDPKTACAKVLLPVDGGFSKWTAWSICNKGCNTGKQSRHRFCTNPVPMHGGKDCEGEKKQEQKCNTIACPKAHSCRHLQMLAIASNLDLPDAVYTIYPRGMSSEPIPAYCDMSRDGGGWTLLITSRTNTWTPQNVELRNKNLPSLVKDYSVLKYANDIKNNLNVNGWTFEYRLEAQTPGRWGGIWQADRTYSFTATTNAQTNVKLVKKFDNWDYANNGIEKRMPWISGARLTTSGSAYSNWWGTIAADDKAYHPAPWISGYLKERNPDVIWYWMREGPWLTPRSCMEVQMRGLIIAATQPDGVYTIQPPGQKEVKTYCDLTSRGGGWTLLVTSKTHRGWSADNVKRRNIENPSLDTDYSILEAADAIKDFDISQNFFQYRIEADGSTQYGGIFDAPKEYTFTSTCDKQINVKLVENFGGIKMNSNLASRMPRLALSSDIFLSTGSTAHDASGSIVYNDQSRDSPSYMPSLKPNPGVIRYWMREGTRRSCNDIKIHGVHLSKTYKDGYFMVRLVNDSGYLPVFCDMTSDPGAYTLVVTSRHNSWKRKQVPARNAHRPSLNADYSILKFADRIKNLSQNKTFKYKLDANERGHWGGIWSAPHEYSFMATSPSQTKVTLLDKFDNWSSSWWRSVQNRMPWFNAHEKTTKALLTTSSKTTYYPSGSIIWGDTEYYPAYWIRYGGMQNPGVIWYWVNEDDCDPNRKPVHGRLSEWSAWGKCDKLCSNGTQRRHKTCTNPVPKCGGKSCNPSQETEERPCYSCPESPIRSYGGYCVQPKSGDCNPREDTSTWSHALIFTSADQNCSAEYMNFLFDADGMIYHKCSGKVVCPQGNYPKDRRRLLLMDSCAKDISMHRRLPSKSLQNKKNDACVHPLGGWPRKNRYLVYHRGCNEKRLSLDFFRLVTP